MRALLKKYKPVLRFVILFLGTYFVLSLAYSFYLQVSENGTYPPDFITNLVAKQTTVMISGFGYNAAVIPDATQPQMNLFINKHHLASIIEGCNAISIIILFAAFIVAFAQNFKKTFLFLLSGAVLIYAVNIIRIVILAIALYHYPEQEKLLHGVVFPGIIYGMVFLLWMLWVRSLSPKIETPK